MTAPRRSAQPMAGLVSDEPRWHAISAEQVGELLDVRPEHGLVADEAARRLAETGANEVGTPRRFSRLSALADQFSSVLIWVLLAAALVSGALLDEWLDASVILAIVILNAALGYSQESRAETALRAIETLSAPSARVRRDGDEGTLPAREVVPGDVILVQTGDRVPADARLIDVAHLEADESLLTGESLPVVKQVAAVDAEAGVADRLSMLFGGSTVTAGRGTAIVTATGEQSQMGRIASLMEKDDPPTPLQVELDRVGRRIAILAGLAALLMLGVGLVRGQTLETMFLLAVALAVAAIPEGLPAIVTVTLARGVKRMASSNAIVRRLPAVEALGAATVICTDKTGTLTRNEIWVQETEFADLHLIDLDESVDDPRVAKFLLIASLCNDARRTPDGWMGDPMEIALVRSVDEVVDVEAMRREHPRLDEAAFDPARKLMTTAHEDDGRVVVMTKGAPEEVIPRCSGFLGRDGEHTLEAPRAEAALRAADQLAERGLRTLALAYRPVAEAPTDLRAAESDLTLVAIAGMRDELRSEAKASVTNAARAGITVVMVTGDHEVTARSIAEELSILEGDGQIMRGDALHRITTDQLEEDVDRYRVYARVDPVDKVKIVHSWQSRDEIVAMTGDGVNDAPALRAADIGVAMGSGTDVAREASDMVLADDNFATIVEAVREGRIIFANLRKVVWFLLAANVSEVLVMVLGFVLLGSLGEPLLATQLLWINLVTDGLPALALGVDEPTTDLMSRPPERNRDVISPQRQLRLLAHGLVLAVTVLLLYFAGHWWLDAPWPYVRTLAFTGLVVAQLGYVYALRAVPGSVFEQGLGGGRLLHLALLGSLLLQLAVVYLPVGNTLFDTEPIAAAHWGLLAGAIGLSVVGVDALERIFRARARRVANS